MIVIHQVRCTTITFGQRPAHGWHHDLYLEQIDKLLKIDDVILQVDVGSEHVIGRGYACLHFPEYRRGQRVQTFKYAVIYEVTIDTGPHPYR